MTRKYPILFLLLLSSIFFAACDNAVVPKAEYDALLKENEQMEAENDSLQFELSSLKDYVEYLEEDNKELVEELNSIPLIEE